MIFEHIRIRMLNTLDSWYLQVTKTSKPGPYQTQQFENLAGIASGYLGNPGGRALCMRLRGYFPTIATIVDDAVAEA